ncbi:GNAT family N-acetyltransferase [Flavobacterium sp.]|uniref:GNAT family N-acetyltransferase n=1 Tax=Flavobacterium sp. TaxID=239 RepID=UPI002B612AB4|nr:GNAT family N-acetyltransferase [Flavobacterium sp.]HSD07857.1 GNAT family N-acetyltransferase [Flavobacterium sp.]
MIEIKKAILSDLSIIQNISKQSFTETFAAINTPENMAKYLEESFNTSQLTSEINNPDSPFYIAFWEKQPVGYLKLNFGNAQTEAIKDNAFEIQRIYVLQDFHGKKIGQLLLDKAIQIAQQEAVDYIWLGVWEENLRAIQFYNKNGFVTFDKHIFVLGNEEQTDLLMKLKITNKTASL